MSKFVSVSEEELYTINGRGGRSSTSSSRSGSSSGDTISSRLPQSKTYISAPYDSKGPMTVTEVIPGLGSRTYTVMRTTKAAAFNKPPEHNGIPYPPGRSQKESTKLVRNCPQ